MKGLDRRAFLAGSLGAVAALPMPAPALAQTTQCVTGGLPAFLPNMLTVDCATRRNFRLFRQYQDHVGLAGVVSMTAVRGKYGSYEAGNLFLFPWLKPQASKAKAWVALLPLNATATMQTSPVPGWTLPIDEYFCRLRLQAPASAFIGFAVDVPYSKTDARLAWFANIDKLADGKGVGVDWTSANLNHPWFGGSRFIPAADACNGKAWRALIADAISRASVGAC